MHPKDTSNSHFVHFQENLVSYDKANDPFAWSAKGTNENSVNFILTHDFYELLTVQI